MKFYFQISDLGPPGSKIEQKFKRNILCMLTVLSVMNYLAGSRFNLQDFDRNFSLKELERAQTWLDHHPGSSVKIVFELNRLNLNVSCDPQHLNVINCTGSIYNALQTYFQDPDVQLATDGVELESICFDSSGEEHRLDTGKPYGVLMFIH